MNTKIYVDNLSVTTTESKFMCLFSTYGNVVDVRIAMDQTKQQSRGFGFVTMVTPAAAQAAIHSLNGEVMGSDILTVSDAPPRVDVTKPSNSRRETHRGPSSLC